MVTVNGRRQRLILASQSSVASSSFAERVEAAASAGFDSIGITLEDFAKALASGLTTREMCAILTANGMRIDEIDAIVGFDVAPADAGRRYFNGVPSSTQQDIDTFFEIAETFGADHITTVGSFGVTSLGPGTRLEPASAERFAALCDRAASAGTKIALEYVGDSNVPTVERAIEIVRDSGGDSGGISADIWHQERKGSGMGALKSLLPEEVVVIQVSDGPRMPVFRDYMEDTRRTRLAPGRGEFDIAGFLQAIYSTRGERTGLGRGDLGRAQRNGPWGRRGAFGADDPSGGGRDSRRR